MSVCNLCPRKCNVDRAEKRGVCGASDDVEIALYQLHYWEEPPISGEAGSGTIFFSHCPLKCIYCQNRSISTEGKGHVISQDELVDAMFDLQSKGALNINLVTGTHYEPQIKEAVLRAKSQGMYLPIVWNTSSYETVEMIRDLNEIVDIYLADFKYFDNELGKKFSGVKDYLEVATDAIDTMVERARSLGCCSEQRASSQGSCSRVIIRHLILPGHVDDSKNVIRYVHERWGERVKLSIMNQYTPVIHDAKYPELLRKVTDEEYEEVLDFADSLGIEDYFWQDGEAASESFIPQF